MRKIEFSDDDISDIVREFQSGRSIQSIADEFDVDRDVIAKRLCDLKIYPETINPVTAKTVCDLFTTSTLTLSEICKIAQIPDYLLHRILSENLSEDFLKIRKSEIYRASKLGNNNPMKGKTGESHPTWKGGKYTDEHGYILVRKPNWYSGRIGSEYVYAHHLVICKALGLTEIPDGFVVHHIDGDKQNNSINNLALVTASGHTRWHSISKSSKE